MTAFVPSLALALTASVVLGLVFERVAAGHRRTVALAAVGAVFAAVAASVAPAAGLPLDGPFLLVAAYFGGPVAAAVALPLPLALHLSKGATLAELTALAAFPALGAAVAVAARGALHATDWRGAAALAALAPLPLLAVALTGQGPPAPWPGAAVLCGVTAVLGLAVANELRRAAHVVRSRMQDPLTDVAGFLSRADILKHLRHHVAMNDRYAMAFAYMLIAIDDGPAMRRTMHAARWTERVAQLAEIVRRELRDCDLCYMVAFDRIGVLLPYTGHAGSVVAAERVQTRIADELSLSVSIGLASLDDVLDAEEVESRAESALFLAQADRPVGAIGPRRATERTDGFFRAAQTATAGPAAVSKVTPFPQRPRLVDSTDVPSDGDAGRAVALQALERLTDPCGPPTDGAGDPPRRASGA